MDTSWMDFHRMDPRTLLIKIDSCLKNFSFISTEMPQNPNPCLNSDAIRLNLNIVEKETWPFGVEVTETGDVHYWMGREGNLWYLKLTHPVEQTIGRIADFFHSGNVEMACEFTTQCLMGGHISPSDFVKIPFHFEKWYDETLSDKQALVFARLITRFIRDTPADSFPQSFRPFIIALRLFARLHVDECSIDDAIFGH